MENQGHIVVNYDFDGAKPFELKSHRICKAHRKGDWVGIFLLTKEGQLFSQDKKYDQNGCPSWSNNFSPINLTGEIIIGRDFEFPESQWISAYFIDGWLKNYALLG
jgi:hypothetical protein